MSHEFKPGDRVQVGSYHPAYDGKTGTVISPDIDRPVKHYVHVQLDAPVGFDHIYFSPKSLTLIQPTAGPYSHFKPGDTVTFTDEIVYVSEDGKSFSTRGGRWFGVDSVATIEHTPAPKPRLKVNDIARVVKQPTGYNYWVDRLVRITAVTKSEYCAFILVPFTTPDGLEIKEDWTLWFVEDELELVPGLTYVPVEAAP